MHLAHDLIHLLEVFRRRGDDEVRALGDDLELVVRDERRDLDDHVAGRVEPGHLEIHPDQHGWMVRSRAFPARRAGRTGRYPAAVLDIPFTPLRGDSAHLLRASRGRRRRPRRDARRRPRARRWEGARPDRPDDRNSRRPRRVVLARSGLAIRHGVSCLNAPGLIDSGYRGEIQVVLVNTDPQ